MATLPRQQRAVLVLRYCEDLPEAEVAALLGCAVGTVKTYAHRGLRALRDLLGGVRARSRRRVVRLRAAAAGAAGIVAVAVAVTLSAVQAPSALAQVTQAAARTAASYQVHAVESNVKIGGLRSQPWATADGEFDPVKGVGEQTDNLGAQIRYAGGYAYVFVTGSLRPEPGLWVLRSRPRRPGSGFPSCCSRARA
jgi:Sigma-70, region 4